MTIGEGLLLVFRLCFTTLQIDLEHLIDPPIQRPQLQLDASLTQSLNKVTAENDKDLSMIVMIASPKM
jgi:hypothetical protein